MTKTEMFELMQKNPVFHIATVEDNQPRCRAMFLYKADEDGIVFHSGSMKPIHNQISKNPRVEFCFNDMQKGIQLRVAGELEIITDKTYKDEVCEHPTRKFVKDWRDSGTLGNFYETFQVYRLKSGKATIWTMATNFAPREEITL